MTHTIYDNYSLWENYTDEDMTELARVNGLIGEDEEPSDDLLWQLRYDEDEMDWDGIKADFDNYFKGKMVIFFGSVGRWDGTFEGGEIGEFWDLFNDAVTDCDYIRFTDDNGALFLKCSHHDGTNYFQIKELTAAGIEYYDRWQSWGHRTERAMHQQIIKRYSHRPHFCKNVWGTN